MLTLEDLSIRFRGPMLLDGVSARIGRDDRIGLLGRNGAGKTTLLKILAGDIQPDHGRVVAEGNARVARLIQDVPRDVVGSIRDVVAGRVSWHEVATVAATAAGGTTHSSVDVRPEWEIEHVVEQTLSRMDLDPDARFEALSSGMRRRVLLAHAIASQPDLLLLDEPTNHLDIASILWLESFLKRWRGTLMFITHDRSFLRSLATRIWEIDRGRLFDWTCDYPTFLARKEAALDAEEKQNALFDKKLAEEEVWIRKGIKARRTRNEGRVRALKAMREQRAERRSVESTAKLNLQTASRGGALVAKVENVSFAYRQPDSNKGDAHAAESQPEPGQDTGSSDESRWIVRDFSTLIMRGDKIGIIGPNGAGKTTLLKLLLGKLKPDEGTVRLGTGLEIAYFDQLRDTLDPEKTVEENVGEGSDRVQVGKTSKHIVGYLQDYLFTPDRARTPVKHLSGGERNRALLAKLMTRPANVMVLDEPTNDLDAETLELLEDQLVGFDGTLLMVSHDRTFLNNVVTSTLVFDDDAPEGIVNEYVGGYAEWEAAVERRKAAGESESGAQAAGGGKSSSGKPTDSPAKKTKSDAGTESAKQGPKQDSANSAGKLNFNEQRELKGLPGKIEKLEAQIAALTETMADPAFYQSAGNQVAETSEKLQQTETALTAAYQRWEELESRQNPA